MYEQKITDPFTGLEINVKEFANKNILVENPITKETCIFKYDYLTNTYTFDAAALLHIKTITLNEAAELLEVTKMRVSKMCSTGILKSTNVCGRVLVDYNSVIEYMKEKGLK